MIRALYSGFWYGIIDFLYPKSEFVLTLESLSPAELIAHLPAASPFEEDVYPLWSYADPHVRELIWELKYRGNRRLARVLSVILFDVIKEELLEKSLFEESWRRSPLLIPMPMSRERRLERGWNQTEILCEKIKGLDTENFLEYAPNLLKKRRHTKSQTLIKDKKIRKTNIENSMEASGVKGRNILLLDDVTTTGASLNEARRTLRSAGAKKIMSFTLAH